MNAEAQAWSVPPFDPDGGDVTASLSARAASRGLRRPLRPANRRPQVVEQEADDVSWNVLAEELVSFPRLATRVLFEGRREVQGRAGSTRDGRKDAELARRYGEAWLERELIAIRYRADAGYPALDHRLMGAARSAPTARVATARAAAVPVASHLGMSSQERRARGIREAAQTGMGAAAEPRGWRRLLPGVATLAAIAGLWAGAGVLATVQRPPLAVLPGSVKTQAGYVYVVRPGDTLWSIATRLQPGADPRVLVAELERQVGGGTLVPGSRLVLP